MNKRKIKKSSFERCLLTEISPYETPLIWSNWGSFNYEKNISKLSNIPNALKKLYDNTKPTIPYNYFYCKSIEKRRILSVVHPSISNDLSRIYKNYSLAIIRLCQKSSFSIRRPHSIAKYFNIGNIDIKDKVDYIEQMNESQAYASSFFVYSDFSHLHKFFESTLFTNMEKDFQYLSYIDIQKCFPSIYTHTIEWAIRSKYAAKELALNSNKRINTIGKELDKFMQRMNYNETNGILVGPEFSRIYAEIILQEIDKKIEKNLINKDVLLNRDYCCFRYIDDYFIFYNNPIKYQEIIDVFINELEKYKLYINSTKMETLSRPFISNISTKKINISKYIQNLCNKLLNQVEKISIEKEINEIRSILKINNEDNFAITNFFISAVTKKAWYIKNNLEKEKQKISIKVFIDITFYLVRIDLRVSTIYRLSKFISTVFKISKSFDTLHIYQIKDKIFQELLSLLNNACNAKFIIETMNLLIIASYFNESYEIPEELLSKIFNMCKITFFDEEIKTNRLTYFEIISFIYYIQNKIKYKNIYDNVIEQICVILREKSPNIFSESLHLLLDVTSCPYIDKNKKKDFVKISLIHIIPNISNTDIGYFVNFVNKYSWYTNWEAKNNLDILLKKKEYLNSYD